MRPVFHRIQMVRMTGIDAFLGRSVDRQQASLPPLTMRVVPTPVTAAQILLFLDDGVKSNPAAMAMYSDEDNVYQLNPLGPGLLPTAEINCNWGLIPRLLHW